jgi:hypothetical protein
MGAVRLRPALLLLTLAGFALRVYGLQRQSFWLDEVDALAFAAQPVGAQLHKLRAVGENGPLYFLLLKAWLALSGRSEFGARSLSAMASSVAIPLTGVLAWRLFRHLPTAAIAAALAALSPFYVWYAQDAKMYPLFAALALGAQYAFLRAWGVGGARAGPSPEAPESRGPFPARAWRARWWAGYVVCSSLALYVHLFAALQIAANTVAGLWLWARHPCGRRGGAGECREPSRLAGGGWRGFVVATALLVLPYLPLAAWQARVLFQGADVGYRPADLRTIVVALLEQLTWHLNPPPDRRLLILLAAVLAWGLWRSRPAAGVGRGATAAVLTSWLVVPVLLTLLIQGPVPVFRDRYLIPLLIPVLLLMARAMAPPWGEANPVGLACALFVAGGFAYGLLHRPPNPDFRAAAALVREEATPGEPVEVGFLAEYAQRPFDFYYRQAPGAYQKIALPYTNYPGMSESDGLRAVASSLRGGRRLWVVRFEDWLWDGRDLTGRYLADRGARAVLRRDFQGVSVTRYELPD